jgi:anti-sigma28 factor (negative regulator of flagellin synthesis)
MDVTQMLSYQRWRNRLERKGLSRIGSIADESFHPLALRHASALLEKETDSNSGERFIMFNFPDRPDEKETRRTVEELAKICKKDKGFRKERVEELKRLIKNNEYHIPGKRVVDKWFPE